MPEKKRKRVLIDTDIACGLPERDVDDALAIVMAVNSPSIKVESITLTYGNDSLSNVARAMDNLAAQQDFPVIDTAPGAGSSKDLNKDSEAVELMARKLEQGPATILAIGPITNVATALELRPDLRRRVEEIVFVAGRRSGQKFLTGNHPLSHPDLNFEKDVEAFKQVLKTGASLVFAPFEVSSKVWITREVIDRVRRNGSAVSSYLADASESWRQFWKVTFSTELLEVEAFNPFDCLAVAWLTDRDLLTYDDVSISVEDDDYECGEPGVQADSGRKSYLYVKQTEGNGSQANSYSYSTRSSTPGSHSHSSTTVSSSFSHVSSTSTTTTGRGGRKVESHTTYSSSTTNSDRNRHQIFIHDVEREEFLHRLIARLR